MKKIVLTGDRPTGKLHLGHYVGSLRKRVELQNSDDDYDMSIMIADLQALTDNAKDPAKIRNNVLEVALDYLAVGLDPTKSTLFIQSQIPALSELTMYYMNLVSLPRLLRNPTIKDEMKQRGWQAKTAERVYPETGDTKMVHEIEEEILDDPNSMGVPIGFIAYPVSQAADITAFNADIVPVGADQKPMIEQTCEIVRSFNATYGETLVEPEALLPEDEEAQRLPGIDGGAKMSKSLNNGIYLADDRDALRVKVMSMFTDPNHIHVDDPGKIEGNIVFSYLDVFAPDKVKVAEMKEHYKRGGLGDVTVKKYLFEALDELLTPIREKRAELAKDPAAVYEILRKGSEKANGVANETLQRVRDAIGVNYFNQ